MSQLKVNALVSYSGNTITLGTSGDTINVASNVTFNTASGTLTLPSTINATTINVTTVVLAAGAAGTPSLTTSGDTNTGIFFPSADTIAFTEGGVEAMRIDSSGNVGIGTTTPDSLLDIQGSGVVRSTIQSTSTSGARDAILRFNVANIGGDDPAGNIEFTYGTTNTVAASITANTFKYLKFFTDNTERLRLDELGNFLFGGTNADPAPNNVNGITFVAGNIISVTRTGGFGLDVNRKNDDGNLVVFRQDGTSEGTISVAGNTVSYNGFTGSHWSRFIDGSKPDILRGTVLESLDQMTDWYHVEFTDNKNNLQKKSYALKDNEKEGDVITYNFKGTDYQATIVKEVDVKHVMSKISDTSEAKNVYGVFSAWDNDDLINNDFYVASVGSYVVRIKAGQTVTKGDLLQSNGDGTAKVQADDIVRASTFAKVLSNTVIQTYEDGSFIVPCLLMC